MNPGGFQGRRRAAAAVPFAGGIAAVSFQTREHAMHHNTPSVMPATPISLKAVVHSPCASEAELLR